MDTYGTAKERVAASQGYATHHGSKIFQDTIVCRAIVLGVQGYLEKQSAHKASASGLFNQMAAQVDQSGLAPNAEKLAIIDASYQSLITDYSDTIYAVYGNFLQAKLAVSAGQLEAANGYLTWVVNNASNNEMLALANLRLGQLAFAQNKLEEALTIASNNAAPFQRQYYSLEGDIYVAQGDKDRALLAYQKSQAAAESAGLAVDQMLSLKITSLTPADEDQLVKPVTTEVSK